MNWACAFEIFFLSRIRELEKRSSTTEGKVNLFWLAPLRFLEHESNESFGLRPCVLTTTIRVIRAIRVRYIKHFYFLFEHELNESN